MRFAALALAAALLAGCSPHKKELKSRKGLRTSGPRVEAPPGGMWKAGRVETGVGTYDREMSGRNFGTMTYWTVGVSLVLEPTAGDERRVGLVGVDTSYEADALAAAQVDWTVSFSPDGRVAVSSDGGKSWTYVFADAGPAELYCPHFSVASADPWASAPSALDVARAIWEEPGEGKRHRYQPHPDEWAAAASWLAAHPVEGSLAETVAVTVRDGPTWDAASARELKRLQDAVAADSAARAACVKALFDPALAWRIGWGNAAVLLGTCADEETQRALGAALGASLVNKQIGGAFWQATQGRVARELARIIESRRAADAKTVETLLACARGANLATEETRFYSVRAVAALDMEEGWKALELAGAEVPDVQIPAWPATFGEFEAKLKDQNRKLDDPAKSWARSAVEARKK